MNFQLLRKKALNENRLILHVALELLESAILTSLRDDKFLAHEKELTFGKYVNRLIWI